MNNDTSWILQLPRSFISIYVLLSISWLLLFDILLKQLIDDLELLIQIQSIKSWTFVFVTGIFACLIFSWRLKNKGSNRQCQEINSSDSKLNTVNNYSYPLQDLFLKEQLETSENEIVNSPEQPAKELQQVAFYDYLTGLPNKTWLLQQLQNLLKLENNQNKSSFAVIFINLDRFATIKYSLGHQIAEQLMAATAKEIQGYLQSNQPVVHVGDEALAILWQEELFELDASAIAKLISQKLNSPITLNNYEIYSPVTIGIAFGQKCAPKDKTCFSQPEYLLDAADTAMNYAKIEAKSGYAVFKPEMHQQAVAQLQLETDLRKGIQNQQLTVVYQPIVSLKTGIITGFEALARWKHPTDGWIAPNKFIPLAEESGLIGSIDWWILERACNQIGLWQKKGKVPDSFTLNVNMSGQMLHQKDLKSRLESILTHSNLKRGSLKLEITERVMMEHHSLETGILNQLKSLGIKLSIDDFGTGYSCLERLHQLPIDTLKIDRSFINHMDSDEESLEIIRTIITLAHGLDMDVVAEGIEEAEQISQLLWLQCEYGQGYLFSKPLQEEAAEQLLARKLYW